MNGEFVWNFIIFILLEIPENSNDFFSDFEVSEGLKAISAKNDKKKFIFRVNHRSTNSLGKKWKKE